MVEMGPWDGERATLPDAPETDRRLATTARSPSPPGS